MEPDDCESFFPYPSYRKGQKELIEEINQKITDRVHYTLIAPNGTGKSIICLTSILPIIYSKDKKLIYLCRTHQQNDRIIKEIKLIKKQRPFINAISLKGRKNACINEDILRENPSLEELMKACEVGRRIIQSKDNNGKKKGDNNKGCKYYRWFKKEISVAPDEMERHTITLDPIVLELIKKYKNKVIETVELYEDCKIREICPYYFIKEILKEIKIIVCNYLWVFSPFILFKALLPKLDKSLSECIIVVDECHNLTDTVLEINELNLTTRNVSKALNAIKAYREGFVSKDYFKEFERFLEKTNEYLKTKEKIIIKKVQKNNLKGPQIRRKDPNKFIMKLMTNARILNAKALNTILNGVQPYLELIQNTIETTTGKRGINWPKSFTFFWQKWINIISNTDSIKKHFFGYEFNKTEKGIYSKLNIKPFDPRKFIKPILEKSFCSLHLSGTLLPEAYKNLTGLIEFQERSFIKEIDSLFKKENIKAVIVRGTSSAYKKRKKWMYERINSSIEWFLKHNYGNTGLFAISYDILKRLNDKELGNNRLNLIIRSHKGKVFKERRGNSSSDNALLIKDFKSSRNAILVGVLGGRNCEGEDFPGKDMENVIIVGFPFAPFNHYINDKISHFKELFGSDKGFLFSYVEPAIRKANQAAGRPIRKEDDKGLIVFLDERYANPQYLPYLSRWITQEGVLSISDISNKML